MHLRCDTCSSTKSQSSCNAFIMAEILTSKSGVSHVSRNEEPSRVPKKTSACLLACAATTLLVSGSWDSIVAKLMNKQFLPPCSGCEPRYFNAPFFQAWTMYVAEAMTLIFVFLDRWIARRNVRDEFLEMHVTVKSFHKPKCPFYWWAIPAALDYTSSVLVNYGFILAHVSTVQLLRNFNVVVTAFLSLLYIRVALRRHQILGVATVTLGLVLTGIAALIAPETDNNYNNLGWLGLVFAIIGTIFNAVQFVFEESLFREYYSSPYEALGYIGVFGMIISSLVLLILEWIPGTLERTSETFYMMSLGEWASTVLILANISFVVSCALFNGSGMIITKVGSGLLRTIIISARTLTIWVVELSLGWNTFDWISLAGLLVTLFGVLVYNYNFILRPGGMPGDGWLRAGVACCSFLRDPDALEEELNDVTKYATTHQNTPNAENDDGQEPSHRATATEETFSCDTPASAIKPKRASSKTVDTPTPPSSS